MNKEIEKIEKIIVTAWKETEGLQAIEEAEYEIEIIGKGKTKRTIPDLGI